MSDTLQFYEEINLQKMVDELTQKIQQRIDEAALDKAADTLASFGYVKADGKSRWFQLFGTPERAARTLTHVCQFTHGGEMCDRCRLYVFNECDGVLRLMTEQTIYDALLEWLKGESDG